MNILYPILIFFLLTLPTIASAQSIDSPIDGVTAIDVIFTIFTWFTGIFGIVAMAYLIWNGLRLIYSRGNEELLAKAKEGTTWAVYGFVFAILSFSIVSATATFFGSTGINELEDPNDLNPPISAAGFDDAIKLIINGFLAVAFVLSILMVVYSGYRMIFSAGNEQQVTKAKTILTWAIVGLVVIVLSYAILNGINLLFGVS